MVDNDRMARRRARMFRVRQRQGVERMTQNGNVLRYSGSSDEVGFWKAANPFPRIREYFEVTILNTGVRGMICVGLVNNKYITDQSDAVPGCLPNSVAFHSDDGKLYNGRSVGQKFGPKCRKGDVIGCGITVDADDGLLEVFFTKNDIKIGGVKLPRYEDDSYLGRWKQQLESHGAYFPAVWMQSLGEEVALNLKVKWNPEGERQMLVDSLEDVWGRLHRIKVTGTLLEYVGEGNHVEDVGLAQTRRPLTTRFHYYELEIMDAGNECQIALGLAHQDYPKNRLPGWNKGSIAYHGDDGKLFNGCGRGAIFGPRCTEGDILGCGIMFPRNYSLDDGDNWVDDWDLDVFSEPNDVHNELFAKLGYEMGPERQDPEGTKVTVFFTRNREPVGRKEVVLPEGGFYPTIGMMSTGEKVRVELYPLSG